MSQTATQIPPMARVSFSEKESSFIASGVLRSSCLACCTPRWMRPICVAEPVAVTTASLARARHAGEGAGPGGGQSVTR